MSPNRRLLVGIAVGTAAGLTANWLASGTAELTWALTNVADPIGQIFIRLLQMLVVPLLFSALVVGVSGLDFAKLGRIGAKTLLYTVVFSVIAVAIGLALVNLLEPGVGASDDLKRMAMSAKAPDAAKGADTSGIGLIVALVPRNPIEAAATGDTIAIMVFSILFGIALSLTRTPGAARISEWVQGLYDVLMTLIDGVLKLVPIGVCALLFSMTAKLGPDVLRALAFYVAVVMLGLALHMFVVYSLSVRFLGGRNPVQFFRDIRLAMLTAFSTASSNATLPTAIKVADENLKLPRHVSRFVLTAGSAMNQNGTALFEGVTVLFLAQLFGVPLGLGEQATIMGICVLAGIGTAGVPSGSIPVIAMILVRFQIPVEGLGLILGVNQLLDMSRTTLNVTGDLAAAVYVARGEPDDPDRGRS